MKTIKFRRPFFKDSYPYEFSHFGIWGVNIDDHSFTGPSSNNSCTHKEDQMFTGLTDRLGKEIYEGDIVIDLHEKHLVEYNEAQFNPFGTPSGWNMGEWETTYASNCEVIGNIHENSDLL